MRVTTLRMQQFRSFVDSGAVSLEQINVLIGANNSGKSAVIRALYQLQQGLVDVFGDVRVGSTSAQVDIELVDLEIANGWSLAPTPASVTFGARPRFS